MGVLFAVVPALRRAPELAARYEPGLTSREYQFGLAEPTGKRGLIAGMGMTEKQGGSDVRANTTRAVARPDGTYGLTGHKWFTSAPMSDLFLVLAQLEEGVSCFLAPRVLPDGSRNGMHLERLKDKLGNRANASAEVEYAGAVGWRLGDEGRGIATLLTMVTTTRLDCVIGSAGLIRIALSEAAHHVAHRSAFGAVLAQQPLMQTVIADLALESGHCCPISMTYAAVPALRHDPALAAAYEPGLRSTKYAFGLAPSATKAGLLAGGARPNAYVVERSPGS